MTLTDAGPLIALIDADEADHPLCVEVLRHLSLPLVTTWPAFTEAMYLLSRAGGPAGRQALWRLVLNGRLELADLDRAGVERSAALMDKYADRPMDVADATLVALPKPETSGASSPWTPTSTSTGSTAGVAARSSPGSRPLRSRTAERVRLLFHGRRGCRVARSRRLFATRMRKAARPPEGRPSQIAISPRANGWEAGRRRDFARPNG